MSNLVLIPWTSTFSAIHAPSATRMAPSRFSTVMPPTAIPGWLLIGGLVNPRMFVPVTVLPTAMPTVPVMLVIVFMMPVFMMPVFELMAPVGFMVAGVLLTEPVSAGTLTPPSRPWWRRITPAP
jgi:hypothetical protein